MELLRSASTPELELERYGISSSRQTAVCRYSIEPATVISNSGKTKIG